jgi:ATP-dependent Clp protease, protease subunit
MIMPMAYVSFCKPVNFDTASTLLNFVRSTLSHSTNGKASDFDRVRLMISSGGGNLIPAFGAYNEIKSMPIQVHTMNTGATDSAALMIFMVGEKRYACPKSAFLFHQPQWTFASKDELPLTVVSDAARWLTTYQTMMAEVIADASDKKLTKDKILSMMAAGTTVTAKEALEIGLVHEIVDAAVPREAIWWQV